MEIPTHSDDFRKYYWLKETLISICKEKKLPYNGSKEEITNRICAYLDGKELPTVVVTPRKKPLKTILKIENLIDENYSNDELHRAFFKNIIGEKFKFNVSFMKWMNENRGIKTYNDAVEHWLKIEEEKKSGKKNSIEKQFEYNQYTRDFFAENYNLSRNDCIKCWNYKKNIPGKHKYEKRDLEILKNNVEQRLQPDSPMS